MSHAEQWFPLQTQSLVESTVSAAEAIVAQLVAAGVDTFFGIPGGPIAPFCQAVRNRDDARFIPSRHEASAAFSAAAYYEACGRVAAVVVTAGPGVCNVVTGIAAAHCSETPMLVVCGDVPWASTGQRLVQDGGPRGLAVERMVGHLCRATVRIAGPASASAQAMAALTAAKGPRPGPALCVLAMDHARAEIEPSAVVEQAQPELRLPPTPNSIAMSARWIEEAERPLLVLGAGCRRFAPAMTRLVDTLGIPFVTTPQAKGLVSEEHPLSLRTGGMAASLWARQYTEAGVDTALVLGTDLDDTTIGPTPYVGAGGRLIHVDRDSEVFGRNLPVALPVVADVEAFADALSDAATAVHPRGALLAAHARRKAPFDIGDPWAATVTTPIAPHRAIVELQRAAGEHARFVSDVGEHMLFALHYLTVREPNAFSLSLSFGSMGSGIAGAVGIALADPSRPVVCVCGDGGMEMNGMEIVTAADLGLPIVYAVFNDARYNMVHHGMRQLFETEQDWETRWVDFAAWAQSFGVPARVVRSAGEVDAALEALRGETQGPVLLDIRIDREVRIRGAGRVEALQRMSVG